MTVVQQVRRIAVIGAGPSGLSAVKYLLAEKCFDRIDVFEKRSSVGGIWNYSPGIFKEGVPTPVPQLSPNVPLEEPSWSEGGRDATFISPIYKALDTNIPKELMRYSDKHFPSEAQVLPNHTTVQRYLEEYAEDVKDLIQLETQVLDVKQNNSAVGSWNVETKNLRTGETTTHPYDAVVVSSGHFDVPYVPDVPGISEWDQTYPGHISHSKCFDSPESFRGKKVLVVGSSASGIDIGAQINTVSKGKLLVSQRTESYLGPVSPDKICFPEIVEYLPPTSHQRAVRFADGRVEEEIDAIVYCTGYFYSFPFLSSLDPPIITNGRRTLNVYQHLFYIYNPTLVFPALNQRIIPFPISENQAAVFARVWSGRLTLPSQDKMKAWEDANVAEKGDGTSYHVLHYPQDADYMNLLYEWAAEAIKRPGLGNDGIGKQGNLWGEKERWLRAIFPEIRKTFVGKGEERRTIKSLEQLGYNFNEWKKAQTDN
ncbi:hypothetical protein ASPWEDRAFT_43033 [Aspergillus wentii DTO 134E9]|uniref:Flavin dependent monooxygenase n=1 Tax=Aspergillus wentii DTO 134E9 TaxID=1073089 RepID=A0A1L9RDR4_ASPWE|nr:uncharacterized protein ASPWEDRAFT_43033 [Aspergillus wentii DTO 134E9]KAI9933264.1 hypothetical protein MW887_007737 [Aspergillus wentii]OJJ32993.1 hypothetical protein ASPWEDRAFT_43033 [Aspergillus wentii DTO 134E9]